MQPMRPIRILLLAFTFCVSTVIIAQPTELQKIEQTLEEGLTNLTLEDFFQTMNIDRTAFFSNKKIKGGYVYYIREYDYFKKLSFSTSWFDFLLLVDNGNDQILYSTVQISGIKGTNTSAFQQYHSNFEEYRKRHEAYYDISIDLADENMSPLHDYAFGTGCGFGEAMPEKGIEMFEMVKNKDQAGLMNWVKSMNPSIQAYGVMGLFFLEKNGHNLTLKRKDKKIVEYVKTKNTIIDYCSNIDLNSTTPMYTILSNFYLTKIWELYKDSKYLK